MTNNAPTTRKEIADLGCIEFKFPNHFHCVEGQVKNDYKVVQRACDFLSSCEVNRLVNIGEGATVGVGDRREI